MADEYHETDDGGYLQDEDGNWYYLDEYGTAIYVDEDGNPYPAEEGEYGDDEYPDAEAVAGAEVGGGEWIDGVEYFQDDDGHYYYFDENGESRYWDPAATEGVEGVEGADGADGADGAGTAQTYEAEVEGAAGAYATEGYTVEQGQDGDATAAVGEVAALDQVGTGMPLEGPPAISQIADVESGITVEEVSAETAVTSLGDAYDDGANAGSGGDMPGTRAADNEYTEVEGEQQAEVEGGEGGRYAEAEAKHIAEAEGGEGGEYAEAESAEYAEAEGGEYIEAEAEAYTEAEAEQYAEPGVGEGEADFAAEGAQNGGEWIDGVEYFQDEEGNYYYYDDEGLAQYWDGAAADEQSAEQEQDDGYGGDAFPKQVQGQEQEQEDYGSEETWRRRSDLQGETIVEESESQLGSRPTTSKSHRSARSATSAATDDSGFQMVEAEQLGELESTEMHLAAAQGDVDELTRCIESGMYDINSIDDNGRTALTYAIMANVTDCIDLLLQYGADVEAIDGDGRTAMHWAAFQGNSKLLKYFIQMNSNTTHQDNEGRSPLHLSTGTDSSKCAKLLVQAIPAEHIDDVDKDQMTAAHWCAFHDHSKHMALLIEKGANLMLQDAEGKLPIHWTSENKTSKTLAKILNAAPQALNSKDNEGRTALHLAVADNALEVSQFLLATDSCELSEQDNMLRTPLHWAAVLEKTEMATLLLDYSADFSSADENGATALHYATQNDNTDCLQAMLAFDHVADVPDNEGRTALMWAAGKGAVAVIGALIETGGDIGAVDSNQGTALHAAAYIGHAEAASTLLEYGAEVDPIDEIQQTPLIRACEHGHYDVMWALLEGSASVAHVDLDLRTPLHWAALGGFDYISQTLLESNADVDARDSEGRTPLQCAAYGGFVDVMQVLCDANADTNSVDNEGVSALHWASSTGRIDAVQLLTERGALFNQTEADGDKLTPLDYATIGDGEGNAHGEIVDFLIGIGGLSASTIMQMDTMAKRIQGAYRKYKLRTGAAKKAAGVRGDQIRGSAVPTVAAPEQKTRPSLAGRPGSGSKAATQRPDTTLDSMTKLNVLLPVSPPPLTKEEALQAKIDELQQSAVEIAKRKRERRAKDRKLREAAQKRETERRHAEQEAWVSHQSSTLMRAEKTKAAKIAEQRRLANFRRKQQAASTIQRFWRTYRKHSSLKGRATYFLTNGKGTKKKKPASPKKATSPSPLETQRSPLYVNMKQKELRKQRDLIRLHDTGSLSHSYASEDRKDAVAALTIQLAWRQHRRRDMVTAYSKRRRAETLRNEWKPARLAEQQRARQSMLTRAYHKSSRRGPSFGGYRVPLTRPTRPSILNAPSAAEVSFSFAIGSYVDTHRSRLTNSARSRVTSAEQRYSARSRLGSSEISRPVSSELSQSRASSGSTTRPISGEPLRTIRRDRPTAAHPSKRERGRPKAARPGHRPQRLDSQPMNY